MDAKSQADTLLEASAQLLYGVPYESLDDEKQMKCIVEALDTFSARDREMADYARKREREGGI